MEEVSLPRIGLRQPAADLPRTTELDASALPPARLHAFRRLSCDNAVNIFYLEEDKAPFQGSSHPQGD